MEKKLLPVFRKSIEKQVVQAEKIVKQEPVFSIKHKKAKEMILYLSRYLHVKEVPYDFMYTLYVPMRHRNASLTDDLFRHRHQITDLFSQSPPTSSVPVPPELPYRYHLYEALVDSSFAKGKGQPKTAHLSAENFSHNEICETCKSIMTFSESKAVCTHCGETNSTSNLELNALLGTKNVNINEYDMPKNLYRPEKQIEDTVATLEQSGEQLHVQEETRESVLELTRCYDGQPPSLGSAQLTKFGSFIQDRELSTASKYLKGWVDNVFQQGITNDEAAMLLDLLKYIPRRLETIDVQSAWNDSNKHYSTHTRVVSSKARKHVAQIREAADTILEASTLQQETVDECLMTDLSSTSAYEAKGLYKPSSSLSDKPSLEMVRSSSSSSSSSFRKPQTLLMSTTTSLATRSLAQPTNPLDSNLTNHEMSTLYRQSRAILGKAKQVPEFSYNYNFLAWNICKRVKLNHILPRLKEACTRTNRKNQTRWFEILCASDLQQQRQEARQMEQQERSKLWMRVQQQEAVRKPQQKALLWDQWMDQDQEEQLQELQEHRTRSKYRCGRCQRNALYASRGFLDCPHCGYGTVYKHVSTQPLRFFGSY